MTTTLAIRQPADFVLSGAAQGRAVGRIYCEAAAAAVVVPGAWVGWFPFMHVMLVVLAVAVGMDIFDWWRDRRSDGSVPAYGGFWLALAAAGVLLVGWCVRGATLGQPNLAIMHATTLGNTVAYILGGYWLLLRGRIDLPALLRATVGAFAMFCLAKVMVEAAIALRWIPFSAVDRIVHQVLHWDMITAGIPPRFVRLQLTNDVFAIVALPAVLLAPVLGWRISPRSRWVWAVLIAGGLTISYSRWLWFATALSCLSGWVLLGRPRRVHFLMLAAVPLAALACATPRDALIERFASSQTLASDLGRVDQIQPLLAHFLHDPWLGAGLGAGVPGLIRNPRPYVYEVQWAQWLMQFGVVGGVIIAGLVGAIASGLWRIGDVRRRGWLLGMYGLWLASGLFNPFLVCTRGVIFVFFIGAALAWGRSAAGPSNLLERSREAPD